MMQSGGKAATCGWFPSLQREKIQQYEVFTQTLQHMIFRNATLGLSCIQWQGGRERRL